MKRRKLYTLEDIDPTVKKKGWKWTPVTISLCVAGALLLCGVIALPFLFSKGSEKERPAIPREEFRQLVMGKTVDEVIEAVGRPWGRSGTPTEPILHYHSRTRDASTGTVDNNLRVFFDGKTGKCVWIDFQ